MMSLNLISELVEGGDNFTPPPSLSLLPRPVGFPLITFPFSNILLEKFVAKVLA